MDFETLALAKKYTNSQQLAYEEPKNILHEVELILDDTNKFSCGTKSGRLGLEVGKTCRVALDSGVYDAVCKSITDNGKEVLYLGNAGAFGNDKLDTGESFVVIDDPGNGIVAGGLTFIDFNKGKKCTIYTGGDVHGIDPKFLPQGGFGHTEVVEKMLTFDGDITGHEALQLDEMNYLVRIGDYIDLSTVKKIEATLDFGTKLDTMTFGPDDFSCVDAETGGSILVRNADGSQMIATVPADLAEGDMTVRAGTYIIYAESGSIKSYTSKVTYSETIVHKIEEEYLPESAGGGLAVVDFDQLGITSHIVQLINAGGGRFDFETASDIEAICNAIPLDGFYCAKLTIPDMGLAYVVPACTLQENGMFKATHLDFTIVNGGTAIKFYVNIQTFVNSNSGKLETIHIFAGLY